MVFSDPVFLYAFLPGCLIAYWLGAWRRRNLYLVAVGSVFYVWGGRELVLLLAVSIVVNHLAARILADWRIRRPRGGSRLVLAIVVADLSSLAVWKYGNFAVDQTGRLLRAIGLDTGISLDLALPIAISFFTFQCISYVVDVWRGTAQPAPKLLDFAAYILLFPHLIAGPIVRYADIEHDLLARPSRRLADFADGAPRFFWGLAKKVLVADQVAGIANAAFMLPHDRMTSAGAWIGAVAYAIQIYFDFSGYSDMAIGLARMFGFHFPENFNRPYSATSLTEFWRRWHISLSSWFRDYVYIPLGGNRRGSSRTYVNLGIVFLLTGLWHGANWTFVAWGAFHGAWLIFERVTGLAAETRWKSPRRLLTFGIVCIGWALFRAVNLADGGTIVSAMLSPRGITIPTELDAVLTNQRWFWLAVGVVAVAVPRIESIGNTISHGLTRRASMLRLAVLAGLAPMACVYAMSSTFSPFLYFQF